MLTHQSVFAELPSGDDAGEDGGHQAADPDLADFMASAVWLQSPRMDGKPLRRPLSGSEPLAGYDAASSRNLCGRRSACSIFRAFNIRLIGSHRRHITRRSPIAHAALLQRLNFAQCRFYRTAQRYDIVVLPRLACGTSRTCRILETRLRGRLYRPFRRGRRTFAASSAACRIPCALRRAALASSSSRHPGQKKAKIISMNRTTEDTP